MAIVSSNSLPQSSLTQQEVDRLRGFNQTRRAVESKFNTCSHIPGVSTISGSIRAVAGAIYTVASLILCGGSMIRGFFTPEGSDYKELRDTQAAYWELQAEHGFFNIARGIIEAVPVVGNGIMLAWDGKFKELVGDLVLPPETYPTD